MMVIVKNVQNSSFNVNLDLIKKRYPKLNWFIDKDNLIGVGGKLTNSNYSYDKKTSFATTELPEIY